MRESNIFSLFTLVGGGGGNPILPMQGTPIPGPDRGGAPSLGLDKGYPSRIQMGGTHPNSRQEYPMTRSGQEGVPTPMSNWGYPVQGPDRGVPHPADGGTLYKIRMGGILGYPLC